MRTNLKPHLGTFVLCKGWIKDWKDIDEKHPQRKVLISQPTIRKPDKDLLFENQPIISTEHHLNLYINKEDLSDYPKFELNNTLDFSGIIEGYMRSNGSIDYGVYPNKQSLLHIKLELINAQYGYMADKFGVYTEHFYKFNLVSNERL